MFYNLAGLVLFDSIFQLSLFRYDVISFHTVLSRLHVQIWVTSTAS